VTVHRARPECPVRTGAADEQRTRIRSAAIEANRGREFFHVTVAAR